MSSNETPAFPGWLTTEHAPGMSLRDYFAGHALGGLASAIGRPDRKIGETQAQADARWSYERANAMMAQRDKEAQSDD